MTQINISGVTMMTRIIAPLMMERKRGLIVNVSSIAGSVPYPLISLYSSSKVWTKKIETTHNSFSIFFIPSVLIK